MLRISNKWNPASKIGFVPTMGALHEGHLELVKESTEKCDITVVSIYVNPAQFSQNEDLDKYPKDFEKDSRLLSQLPIDYIFLPNNKEMYPEGYNSWVHVEELTTVLCGAKRPGHFTGVCTIVLKLVNIVKPSFMFMGEKDFQQVVVLETMLKELNVSTSIVRCKIVRALDGLALSSRNKYLTESERKLAPIIQQTILSADSEFFIGNLLKFKEFEKFITDKLGSPSFKIDYIDIVDSQNLQRREVVSHGDRLLVAVYLGSTRLIDNIEIK